MDNDVVKVRSENGEIYFDNVIDREGLASGAGAEGIDASRVFAPLRALAHSLTGALADLEPDEITIEASAKISGKVGLVFTSAEAESAFRVSFTWKKHT